MATAGLGTIGQCVADRLRVKEAKKITLLQTDGNRVDLTGNFRTINTGRMIDDGRAAELWAYDVDNRLIWQWKAGDPVQAAVLAEGDAGDADYPGELAAADDAGDAAAGAQLARAPAPLQAGAARAAAPASWAALDALDALQAKGNARLLDALRLGAELVGTAGAQSLDVVLKHNATLQQANGQLQATVQRQAAELANLRAELAQRPVVLQEIERPPADAGDNDAGGGFLPAGVADAIGEMAGNALATLGKRALEAKQD